ncbi:MAG: BatD family protein [bacterium]|nr:BatD family protein [bacterium]
MVNTELNLFQVQPKTMRRIILLTAIILLAYGCAASAAEINFRAATDRNTLSMSESLTLSFHLEGKMSNVPDPQMPDLSDWNVLSGPNESSSFQFINGQTSYSKDWSFVLNPKRAGQLTIGSALLTIKNLTYRTDPITVTVSGQASPAPSSAQPLPTPPSSAPQSGSEPSELFVRVNADNTNIYQNQQVILTYTIYTRVNVNGFEVSKLPSTPGFWQEDFQQAQQPPVRDEVISGRHYRAAQIRQVALFPTRSGDLTIDPLEVTCQVQMQDTQRRRRDPFDMFFDSPFAGYRTEKRVVSTQPLTLHVKPLPEDGRPADYSGSVGDFNLIVDLDKQAVKTNEALTMTVRFNGSGNIKALPKPNFSAPSDFEAYDPKESVQVDKSGGRVTGTKTFEYILIPRAPGKTRLPPISFSYFDPASRSYRTLTGGGYDLEVAKGSGELASSVPGIAREDVKLLAEDIHYLKTPQRLLRIGPPRDLSFGYWALMILPPLLALLLWWGARMLGGAALQAKLRSHKAYDRAKRQMREIGKTSASSKPEIVFGGVHKILMDFISEKLNAPASGLKEEEILEKIAENQIEAAMVEEVKNVFLECNFARFTSGNVEAQQKDQIVRRAEQIVEHIEIYWGGKS